MLCPWLPGVCQSEPAAPVTASVGSSRLKSNVNGFRIVLCGLFLALSACAQFNDKEPRYHVIMQHELHADMHTMAQHLNKIANISLNKSVTEQEKTSTVLHELEQIKVLATSIASPGEITNYSAINRYMDAFIYDVLVAEQFSSRRPPNHFPAYTLVKSCLSCHQSI